MPRPEDCLFTKTHEWVHAEGATATIGITDFAQQELGDIVYVNLGETGRTVSAGAELAEIESVKAVAEVYAPVTGKVTEINPALEGAPEMLNKEPFAGGWLLKIELADRGELGGLMNFAAYTAHLETEAH